MKTLYLDMKIGFYFLLEKVIQFYKNFNNLVLYKVKAPTKSTQNKLLYAKISEKYKIDFA